MNKKTTYPFIYSCLLSVGGGLAFIIWVLKRIYTFHEAAKDKPGMRYFNASIINAMQPGTAWLIAFLVAVALGFVIYLLVSARRGNASKVLLGGTLFFAVVLLVTGMWFIRGIEHRYFKHSMYLKILVVLAAPVVVTGMIWFVSLFGKKKMADAPVLEDVAQ